MKHPKVLMTEFFPTSKWLERLEKAGYSGQRRQISIVCKCAGIADANRKCENYGLDNRIFDSAYAHQTYNESELLFMESTEIAFIMGRSSEFYVSIEQLLSENGVDLQKSVDT